MSESDGSTFARVLAAGPTAGVLAATGMHGAAWIAGAAAAAVVLGAVLLRLRARARRG
jgi:hypothetical protein